MEIDATFPTKLDTVSETPEPLRSALVESLPADEPVRLLVHSPSFPTRDEKSPATVLAVTNNGWLIASETEAGGATLEKSQFSEILFLELRSILLLGQLRISFAEVDSLSSTTIKFEGVGDELYHQAIDLILAGIDPAPKTFTENDLNEASMFENWPMKFRNEARRYWPRGQRLLAALRWPAVDGESKREMTPAGALLVTGRELVLISDEISSSTETSSEEESEETPREEETPSAGTAPETISVPAIEKADIVPGELPGDVYEFGEVITFVPRVRLANFQISQRDHFSVLTLEVHAAHGREKLEILFPSDRQQAVSQAMEQVSLPQSSATETITRIEPGDNSRQS
jgi:hypothetical protein